MGFWCLIAKETHPTIPEAQWDTGRVEAQKNQIAKGDKRPSGVRAEGASTFACVCDFEAPGLDWVRKVGTFSCKSTKEASW